MADLLSPARRARRPAQSRGSRRFLAAVAALLTATALGVVGHETAGAVSGPARVLPPSAATVIVTSVNIPQGGVGTVPVTVHNGSGSRLTTRVALLASTAGVEGTDDCRPGPSPFRRVALNGRTLPRVLDSRRWCGRVAYRYTWRVDIPAAQYRTYRLRVRVGADFGGVTRPVWMAAGLMGSWWNGQRWVDGDMAGIDMPEA